MSLPDRLDAVFRQEWGPVLATLIRLTGDWELAEECVQDAFAQAMETWPRDGVPRRPGGWLTTTARNRALDRLRRKTTESEKLRELVVLSGSGDENDDSAGQDSGIADDLLRLIFTCCHPALTMDARVALTLRTVAGLSTAQIARAFLVPEQTMAKRLVRAKRKIEHAGIPYRVPPAHLLPDRLGGVLAVLYLLFNEGYAATAGELLIHRQVTEEAIRLTRLLAGLMPDEPEVLGLLALQLLHDSRRAARQDESGELVRLADQDRSLWDRTRIDEGTRLLESALRRGRPGPYQIQAAISACHATASTVEDTDWSEIAQLYGQLLILVPSPVIRLNRAVAIAMTDGPAAGLALVDALSEELADYHLRAATRADLLTRLGRRDEAAAAYREAIALARTEAEKSHLARRRAELDST